MSAAVTVCHCTVERGQPFGTIPGITRLGILAQEGPACGEMLWFAT